MWAGVVGGVDRCVPDALDCDVVRRCHIHVAQRV